tara:strand:+ start:584 stop:1189 length:606 start_codon:yes stop_codon:yes gene_type:complete
MVNELIKLADELDAQGFKRQANKIDRLIKKAALRDRYEPSYLGMNQEEFRDLVVSVYETHFDETGEGWDPHEDDIEDIYSYITVIPHPSDDDYEPEEDGKYWEYHGDGEYTFKGEMDFDSMSQDALKNYEVAMKIVGMMPHLDDGKKDSRMEMSEDDRKSWEENIDKYMKKIDDKKWDEHLVKKDPRDLSNPPVDTWAEDR